MELGQVRSHVEYLRLTVACMNAYFGRVLRVDEGIAGDGLLLLYGEAVLALLKTFFEG